MIHSDSETRLMLARERQEQLRRDAAPAAGGRRRRRLGRLTRVVLERYARGRGATVPMRERRA